MFRSTELQHALARLAELACRIVMDGKRWLGALRGERVRSKSSRRRRRRRRREGRAFRSGARESEESSSLRRALVRRSLIVRRRRRRRRETSLIGVKFGGRLPPLRDDGNELCNKPNERKRKRAAALFAGDQSVPPAEREKLHRKICQLMSCEFRRARSLARPVATLIRRQGWPEKWAGGLLQDAPGRGFTSHSRDSNPAGRRRRR
jgi:hypothetical protein